MHKLVIQDDEGKTTVVPLIRDEITVGRKEGNTIRLTERNVSRRHARIVRKNGSVAIEDLNSYNGVRVNGSRIQGRVGLNVSDRVQIGDYLIELKADGAVVGAEGGYGDETQPIDTADLRTSSPSLPAIPQQPMLETEAATTKMPMAPMMPGASMPPQPAPALGSTDSVAPGAMPPQVQEATPARLVILSTNFAGREFELHQPAMVIGRTDDNDLVVNHRSISRHHAKIVRENGRYAIVDLQSSNGVRVNGEEYSKVELRRGDLIDLGHVRLRFVEPGEDFLFGRDAQAVSIASGGNRKMIYALAGVLVIGLIAVFALTRGGGSKDDQETTDQATSVTEPDKNPSAEVEDKGADTQQAVVNEPDSDKIKPFIEKARSAIDAEKWGDALKAANEALAVAPQSEEAKQLASKAQNEQQNENRFKEFKRASKKKDYPQVATLFEAIDSDSIYKNRARDEHDRHYETYKSGVMKRARALAKKSKCNDLSALEAEARNVWTTIGDAVASVECKKVVASTSRRTSSASGSDTSTDTGTDPKDDDPEENDSSGGSSKPSKTYDQLMEESRAAYMSGQFGKSKRLCNDALKIKSRDMEAATLCGFAACNMKNAKLAKRYQNMLPESRKSSVRQVCLKAGLRDFQ